MQEVRYLSVYFMSPFGIKIKLAVFPRTWNRNDLNLAQKAMVFEANDGK